MRLFPKRIIDQMEKKFPFNSLIRKFSGHFGSLGDQFVWYQDNKVSHLLFWIKFFYDSPSKYEKSSKNQWKFKVVWAANVSFLINFPANSFQYL